MEKNYRRNLLALMISWVVWVPFTSMTRSYSQLFQKELGASPFIISLISFTFTLTFAFSKIFGGYITDKYGRRKILVRTTFLAAFSSLIYAIASDWKIILIGSIINGLALLYQPALRSIIADSTKIEYRGRTYALINFIPNLLSSFSPLFAVYLISIYNLVFAVRLMYILSFIGGIMAGIIRLLFIRETFEGGIKTVSLIKSYKDAVLFVKRSLFSIVFLKFFMSAGYALSILKAYYVVYFLNLSSEDWGYFMFLGLLAGFIASIPIGFIVDKIGRKYSLSLSTFLCFSGSILLYIASLEVNLLYFIVLTSIIVYNIGFSGSFSAFPALLMDLTPVDKRGRVNTLMSILEDVIAAFMGLLAGYIYEVYNPRIPFLISAFSYLIGFTIVVFFIRETMGVEKEN